MSACGSHVLQACYSAADTRIREQIVQAVASDEQKVAATRHGAFLMKRLGVSEFNQAPEVWKNRTEKAEDVKADFAKTFGVAEEEQEMDEKKRKVGGDEEPAEDEPTPKKQKKEKKEKKEKKAKKEKK